MKEPSKEKSSQKTAADFYKKKKKKIVLSKEARQKTLKRVLLAIQPYSFLLVVSLLCAVISVGSQLYVPILTGKAIDHMLSIGRVSFADITRIVWYILIMVALTFGSQWLFNLCNNRMTYGVARDLRNRAIQKIQQLPLSYLDAHASGDLVSRMIADIDTFTDGLLLGFTQLFTGLLTIGGTIVFMLYVNVPIAVAVIAITPLNH